MAGSQCHPGHCLCVPKTEKSRQVAIIPVNRDFAGRPGHCLCAPKTEISRQVAIIPVNRGFAGRPGHCLCVPKTEKSRQVAIIPVNRGFAGRPKQHGWILTAGRGATLTYRSVHSADSVSNIHFTLGAQRYFGTNHVFKPGLTQNMPEIICWQADTAFKMCVSFTKR